MEKRIGIILLLLTGFCGIARADSDKSTGMHFLLTGPSAHNMGLSDGHTASLSGASAIFLNPALLSMEASSSAVVSYMIWPATDTQNSFAAVNFKRDRDAFGLAILSSLIDDIPLRSGVSQQPDGYFAVRYLSLAASYSRRFGPLSLGASGMYLFEQFYHEDASGYALNAGLALELMEKRVRLGTALKNLGSMQELSETATQLPTMISIGADVKLFQVSTSALEEEIPFLFSLIADYNIPVNELNISTDELKTQDDGYFNVGFEIGVSDMIDLRAAYRTGDTQRKYSFGAGLHISDFYVNYAYMPYDTGFGVAHAISLQYAF
ncbi:PorV/PorQ family protein [Balneolaceae bacterium ANBcel3]|nr:PorV/PorQ family protein [Balneolaceae bacterium ANBcel3]